LAASWLTAAWYGLFSLQSPQFNNAITAMVLLAIAIIADELAVEFSKGIFVSVWNLPVLLAIVFLDPFSASIIALVTAFFSSRHLRPSSILFNSINYILATAAASLLFALFIPTLNIEVTTLSIELLAIVVFASITLILTNFSLGSIFIWLRDGTPFKVSWGSNFINAMPSETIFIGISLMVVAVYAKTGIAGAILFFIPIFASQHVYGLLVQQKELLAEQTKLSQDLMEMNIGLAGALIMLLDSKDHYTASHSAGVAMYCRDMAKIMGLSEDEQQIAHMAGLLHDLGKVGTPDAVLKKEGELTAHEWEQIKQHPTTAAEVLSQLTTHKEIADIIRHHQEHFDGSGYPYGISGDDIPELSRMLSVADTYHALTSDRPYRKAKSPFEALIILRQVAGTQLDPKYVEVMAQVLKNEDLSYREGSKTDFLSEFRKGRPAIKLDALKNRAKEQ
jgi:putative nucleotidyltransferase with HDIG domain